MQGWSTVAGEGFAGVGERSAFESLQEVERLRGWFDVHLRPLDETLNWRGQGRGVGRERGAPLSQTGRSARRPLKGSMHVLDSFARPPSPVPAARPPGRNGAGVSRLGGFCAAG